MKKLKKSKKERWKPVSGYEGFYEVSNRGNVRSLDRTLLSTDGRTYHLKGQLLTPVPNTYGYLQVALCRGKQNHLIRLMHKLVAETFIGPCPKGMECCHNDGNKTNNRLNNIRYDFHTANLADRNEHGTAPLGSKNSQSKLSEKDVVKIRNKFAKGKTTKYLAHKYGVTVQTIRGIIRRRTWKHVGGADCSAVTSKLGRPTKKK